MSDGDNEQPITEVVQLIGEMLKAAGNDVNVKAAGSELGKSALTVTKALNNCLLPIAAVNFGFEKAKTYFERLFPQELAEKTASIPEDQLVEPKAYIAAPVLQGLAFSHGENSLKDMYLSLLSRAMDKRHESSAHPAFVEIIRQLSPTETSTLSGVLRTAGVLPLVELRLHTSIGDRHTWTKLATHLIDHVDDTTQQTAYIPESHGWVHNWIRLGLVQGDYREVVAGTDAYKWVESNPLYVRLKSSIIETPTQQIRYQRGQLSRTEFGIQFAKVVGILPD